MSDNAKRRIKKIIIVGGGTAGWMTAAAFSKVLGTSCYDIVLIESDDIGTVGVGEATIPLITSFNQILGLDESQFMKKTQATFKLGIEFVNWGNIGDRYIHPFGVYGKGIGSLAFYNFLLKQQKLKPDTDVGDYSINIQAARHNKFMRAPNLPNSPLADIRYAYHFDAGLYALYLRNYAEQQGAIRVQGEITNVSLDDDSGCITSVTLKDGQTHSADFFIDCSGFRGLLIEQALKTGYEDWSHLLLSDTAVTVPSEVIHPLPSFTRSTAHSAGWQWCIPLQHRTGNGHVFSSRFMSEDEATSLLLQHLPTPALAGPRTVKFKTGIRRKLWNKNCVAIGLSSGFIEPLESTSIHLIHSAIHKLLTFFPTGALSQVDIDKYNDVMRTDIEFIRDFILLHYKATSRTDSAFWNHCRTMDVPDGLRKKMELYIKSGRLYRDNNELFTEDSWFAVMEGQGVKVEDYHPLVDSVEQVKFDAMLGDIARAIRESTDVIPSHAEYIARYCKA